MKDAKPKLKVVVRNLPPQLTEEQFQQAVQKNLTNVDFWYYCPGEIKDKSSVNARAYLHFNTENGVRQFVESFNGHIFITPKGKEQKAQIEPAPFQTIPKSKIKPDRYDNTIDNDPDYLQFLESLTQPQTSLPSAEEQLDKRIAEGKDGAELISPLLQFLIEKKAAKEKQKEQVLQMKRERAERRKAEKKALKESTATDKPKPERKEKREKKRPDKVEGETPRRGGGGGNSRNSNPNWQAKRLEPGAISILKTPASASPAATTPVDAEPAAEKPRNQQPQQRQQYREKNVKVMYAPKQKTPQQQQPSEQE